MADPAPTHYATPGTQRTACGVSGVSQLSLDSDSARVDCAACQEKLARQAERRLRGPPLIGDPKYAAARATLREVERAVAEAVPWAVGVRVDMDAGFGRVLIILGVAEDPEYYRDHAYLVAERLRPVLPIGVECRVEVELAESRDG